MKDLPVITVLIASHNRLSFLKKCIDSCINQDSENYDILIVDDGSDDETKDWLKKISLNNEMINVHYQKRGGVGQARQKGLDLAIGEYICILDSDDLLVENAMHVLKKEIDSNKAVDLFYCNNLELYPSGKFKKSSYPVFSTNQRFLNAIFTRPRVPFKHSGTTFKRGKILEIGGYNSNIDSKIDIELMARVLNTDLKVSFIPQPLVWFNFHDNSISRKSRLKGLTIWWKIIDKHGPKSLLLNFIFKFARTFFEALKFIVEKGKL